METFDRSKAIAKTKARFAKYRAPILLDNEWNKIKRRRPEVPNSERANLDRVLKEFGMRRTARRSTKSQKQQIAEFGRVVLKLLRSLVMMDSDTMDNLMDVAIDDPTAFDAYPLSILVGSFPGILKVIVIASKNAKTRTSKAKDLEYLFEKWDATLQKYSAGKVSRPNLEDVFTIANAAARLTDIEIGKAAVSDAVENVSRKRRGLSRRRRGPKTRENAF
jgi:hypothetical protein